MRGTVGGKRRKDGTMIGTAKIFWLGLNEVNDEKVLKRNILTWWIFGMSQVLRSGGPNHSKPSVFIVFLHLDRTNPTYPQVHSPSEIRQVRSTTQLGLPPDKTKLNRRMKMVETDQSQRQD